MVKYGISQEGVDALNQLASDIGAINGDIEGSGQTLADAIDALGSDLGVYEDEIIDLVASVNATQEKGRESAEHLSNKVSEMAANVEELVNSGL